jgi:hypothetical protein
LTIGFALFCNFSFAGTPASGSSKGICKKNPAAIKVSRGKEATKDWKAEKKGLYLKKTVHP